MVWTGPETCIVATDGGLYKTEDHGVTWEDIENIENSQFYRVTVNPHYPGRYTGGAQDNGTTSGSYEDINGWNRDRGGDGFTPIFHPEDPNFRIATVQYAAFAYSTDPQTDIGMIGHQLLILILKIEMVGIRLLCFTLLTQTTYGLVHKECGKWRAALGMSGLT